MSTQTPVHAPCPACGHNFKSLVAVVINLPTRPDLLADMMQGRLNLRVCPECGHTARFVRTVATIDFDRKEWVYGYPVSLERHWQDLALMTEAAFDKNMRYAAPRFMQEQAADWKIRTVLGYEGLREQRVISDAGLDDVAVEHAKLHLLAGRPEWAGARISLRAFRDERALFWVRDVPEPVLVDTSAEVLRLDLPPGFLPGALGADAFVSYRRFLVRPVPGDARVLNRDGTWDTATGAGDPREPLIRL